MSTETKVRQLVREIIPKGKPFRMMWHPAGFSRYHVVRVITPAWRSLPRFQRILKVQKAVMDGLAPKERAGILRVSVLTADEYKKLHPSLLPRRPLRLRTHSRRSNGK